MDTRFESQPKNDEQELLKQGNSFPRQIQANDSIHYSYGQLNRESILPELVNNLPAQNINGFTHHQFSRKLNISWQRLGLRQKATALAIALGTIPVMGLAAINYLNLTKDSHKATQSQLARATTLQDAVRHYISERYVELQELAELPLGTSQLDKQAALDHYLEIHRAYDSIAVFNLNGSVIAQSKGPLLQNFKAQNYLDTAISTGKPVIASVEQSTSTGQPSIYFTAPIKDKATGKIVAVVRTRLPIENLKNLIQPYGTNEDEYYLIDTASQKILLAKDNQAQNKQVQVIFPGLAQLQADGKPGSIVTTNQIEKQGELLAYVPLAKPEDLPELKWGTILSTPTDVVFKEQRDSILTLVLGTGVTVLLVSAIATDLAKRVTRPILSTSKAVEKIGQGELNTRIELEGEDELAVLAANINLTATRLQILLKLQAVETEKVELFADIAVSQAQTVADLNAIYYKTVQGALDILAVDRVVIYCFHPNKSGYILAEAVVRGRTQAIGNEIVDACIGQSFLDAYERGLVVATNNVFEAGFHPDHLALLTRLDVKANLVAPILKDGQLFGLLIAHHCASPHEWQQLEIDFLKELAIRVGLCLDRVNVLDQKAAEAERAQQLNEISSRIRDSLQVPKIYQIAVTGICEALKTDRAIVYQFDENWQGTIVAESVGDDYPVSLGKNIADPCFAEQYLEKYQHGRVRAVDNIYDADLSECYLGQLEPFEVKANLVAPILTTNKLHGLLVTHQCSAPRNWQVSEINFCKQVATQVGLALDRVDFLAQIEQARQTAEALAQEQRQKNDGFQHQILELLNDVEEAAQGNLTVRANVTEGEIGTVADFFNAVIESLRGIVTQVKIAATQVNASLGENEGAIRQLSAEALKQAEETIHTLDSVEQMSDSIQQVAENARQAATVARMASSTAEAGGQAMDRSVQSIFTLRQTVAETAKKVKRLGESSQKISKVAALIDQIALQTNLLAINAGIEAARAGEEGQGFAVVAEEVGELANRSAAATREIEVIVSDIQQETAEVVKAMEVGTSQVVEGTHLVEEAKQSLNQILDVSRQIDALVQSISQATVSQAQTSQVVTQLMQEIARVSERTSNSTRQVSGALQATVEIAGQLQASVSTFKVDED